MEGVGNAEVYVRLVGGGSKPYNQLHWSLPIGEGFWVVSWLCVCDCALALVSLVGAFDVGGGGRFVLWLVSNGHNEKPVACCSANLRYDRWQLWCPLWWRIGPSTDRKHLEIHELVQLGCGVAPFVILGREVHGLSDYTVRCAFFGFGWELNGLIRRLFGGWFTGRHEFVGAGRKMVVWAGVHDVNGRHICWPYTRKWEVDPVDSCTEVQDAVVTYDNCVDHLLCPSFTHLASIFLRVNSSASWLH